jgi:hypothetical protein
MNIFKLSFTDKDQAIADLVSKDILIPTEEGYTYGEGVQAVVELGPIEGVDGYHYDVMSTEMYDFGANLVEPKNPKHAFAGYAITDEV